MTMRAPPRLAQSGLRQVSGLSRRSLYRSFALSCARPQDAWGVRKDNSEQSNTEPHVQVSKLEYNKPAYRPVDTKDRPPPFRVRREDEYRKLAEEDPPVSYFGPRLPLDATGLQGRNALDNSLSNKNTTATKQRTKQSGNRSGDLETRQRIPSPSADSTEPANAVGIFVDGKPAFFSPLLLRDLCECPSCLDPSTKQKLFSTADIPSDIKTRAIAQDTSGVTVLWENDISGYGDEHATTLDINTVRSIRDLGEAPSANTRSYEPGKQLIWDAQQYRQLDDIDYEAYMQDEATFYRALQQLHTHGLLFLRNVPEDKKSVSNIAERIGPVKNTFYGYTWDVRSVPEAKNVAYTSQDLGFHMDLMYMHQPPHLQFLHCIRSSAAGGASLFADSYRAAANLFQEDVSSFFTLAATPASFQYNHPPNHLYHQDWSVIQTRGFTTEFTTSLALNNAYRKEIRHRDSKAGRAKDIVASFESGERNIVDYIRNVAWSPPFQAPFRITSSVEHKTDAPPSKGLNNKITRWHSAAQKFSAIIHREQGMYERLMKPGECAIFNNRRVVHARRAFAVGDAGKERWLRGAYLDWDPYWSKMSVLGKKFGSGAGS